MVAAFQANAFQNNAFQSAEPVGFADVSDSALWNATLSDAGVAGANVDDDDQGSAAVMDVGL